MKPTLLVLAALVLASPVARAAVPDPRFSTLESVIVSSWNNTAAPLGPCYNDVPGYDLTVRDINNAPIPGSHVKIVFGSPAGIRPYQDVGPGPVTVNCVDHSINIVADGQGRVHFVPHFGRYSDSYTETVYADGVILGNLKARSPDYDGDGDVDVADWTTFVGDYLDMQNYHARSDFDLCPNSNLPDFSFFVQQYLASGAGGARSVCP